MPPSKRGARAPRHRTLPDPLAAQVGARVRDLRKERGYTFDAWVETVGLGRGYVSELERGLVVPTITTLARIAEPLGVTIADLVLGHTSREQLFALTGGMSETAIQRLLEVASAIAPDAASYTRTTSSTPTR